MNVRKLWRAMLLCIPLALLASTAQAEISQKDRELANDVWEKLLIVAEPVEGYAWPPKLDIIDEEVLNAYATLDYENPDEPQPLIFLYQGILEKVIEGKPDRLAYLLGHELSHILCKHVDRGTRRPSTPLVEFAATRAQEEEADLRGLELALAAGYSKKDCLGMIRQMIALGQEYTSFEGLNADHPSWNDRGAYIDEDDEHLWRSMSAFKNGVYFIMFEQYPAAIFCFENVTKEFPGSSEAWANLGYARLMEYCDALSSEDLQYFDIGQLAVGGFYTRPGELLRTGPDEKLWFAAVGALNEALRLNPNSMVAAANLGVAYLVHPTGKQVGEATRYFEIAATLAEEESGEDALARASVLANAAVADLAAGRTEEANARFEMAQDLQRSFSSESAVGSGITGSLMYQQATLLSNSKDPTDKKKGVKLFEQYLRTIGPSSAWWGLAYKKYVALCESVGVDAQSENGLQGRRTETLRPVTAITLPDGEVIRLTEKLREVEAALGEGESLPVVRRTLFKKLRYADRGIDLLTTDQVLAIWLTEPDSPAVQLRASGVATEIQEISVGMSRDDLDEVLGNMMYDYRQLYDPEINYRFYRDLGIAIRIRKGEVAEIIVVQIPERTIR